MLKSVQAGLLQSMWVRHVSCFADAVNLFAGSEMGCGLGVGETGAHTMYHLAEIWEIGL